MADGEGLFKRDYQKPGNTNRVINTQSNQGCDPGVWLGVGIRVRTEPARGSLGSAIRLLYRHLEVAVEET